MNEASTYRRLAVESIAIIGSILLAFSVDAWWEESKESKQHAVQLSLLNEEIRENIEQFRRSAELNRQYAQNIATLGDVLQGRTEISSSELDDLMARVVAMPGSRPQLGMVDFLTAFGSAALSDRPELLPKLMKLKANASTYTSNQDTAAKIHTSDTALYSTGNHIVNFDTPGFQKTKDPMEVVAERERAIKNTRLLALLFGELLAEQADALIEDLEEVAALLK